MDRMEREYGPGGWIGVGVPQANPTVEAEVRRLLPPDAELLTSRLVSRAPTSVERLIDYFDGLDRTLDSYDVLRPDVYGFACTGSSYLVGAEREAEIVAEAEARLGCPFVTAAQAILDALAALAVERVALLAPYPADIVEAGVAFWRAAGLSVVQVMTIDLGSQDTRRIYGLRSADALAALDDGVSDEAEALLMSGTGMPTLAALAPAADRIGRPVLSSNYCLAWALRRALGEDAGLWSADGPGLLRAAP
ncbi:MAG: hypothetical protein OXH14_04340 [Alphaproteobacteria bacterium]|nr:hypothetical protein [Alphaproteobacteria bacterium]